MTHRELASQLNISPAALSLILNNKPGVSDATRMKIKKQLSDMGYAHLIRKNDIAVLDQIAFIVYKRHGKILDQHPFFLLMMEGIETHARKYNYQVILTSFDIRSAPETQVETIRQMPIKGAIIFGTEMQDDDISYLQHLNVPYVVIDNDFPQYDINTVAINNTIGTYEAIEYLIRMGHRNIGYLKSSTSIKSFDERDLGYHAALSGFGYPLKEKNIVMLRYTEEGSYQDFLNYLSASPALPSAFVADDDTIAIGALRALREKGYSVPEDISVIGFNDRPSCEISQPPLTSINVPRHSFGSEAVDMLMKLIDKAASGGKNERSLKLRIGTQLIVRDSVKKTAD